VDQYLEDLVRSGIVEGERHWNECRLVLMQIGTACKWKYVADIDAEQFKKWQDEGRRAGRAPRTLNKRLQALAHFVKWAKKPPRRWFAGNPLDGVERMKEGQAGKRRIRRAYTLEEFRRLMEVTPADRAVVYAVAAFSGLRKVELKRLQKRDCDPRGDRPRWHLRPEVSKNGLAWNLPMLPECAELLLPLWERATTPESPLFGGSGRRGHPKKGEIPLPKISTLYEDLERAGIARKDDRGRHADFHCFRYLFCKTVGQKLPIQKVKVLMRHLTLQMTADLYGQLEMEDVAEEVWDLPNLFQERPKDAVKGGTPANTPAA
jgi:integrase